MNMWLGSALLFDSAYYCINELLRHSGGKVRSPEEELKSVWICNGEKASAELAGAFMLDRDPLRIV